MKTLIYVEFADKKLKNSSKELLSVANSAGAEITTLSFGQGSDDASELSTWGVTRHYYSSTGNLEKPNPDSYLDALTKVFEKEKPEIILASSNTLAKDIFPRLAVRSEGAFVSDITELSLAPLSVRRPLYAGKCSAKVEFKDNSVKILLVRPNQLPVIAANKSSQPEKILIDANAPSMQLVQSEKSSGAKLDLTEANIIVSGGRGLKEGANFKLLQDMAEPIGATVGASRAVVDLGWVSHSMQVGQTGKTVAPSLYIAAGISGAIQHLAGMSSSKVIVAINTDEKAPIFQKATYGLVGDIFQIAPVLTSELKALQK